MSRAPYKIDRLATIVVAILMLALGLVLLDWRYHLVLHGYPKQISLGSLAIWADTSWWAWAFAAITLLLGVLGLWWLLAHLRRNTIKATKMPQSGPQGTITMDTSSLANAIAQTLQDAGPFSSVAANATQDGRATTVLVNAYPDQQADGPSIIQAIQEMRAHLRSAFPDHGVSARVLIARPRGSGKSSASARVR